LTTKSEIIQAVQDAADAYYADPAVDETAGTAIKLGLGSPGEVLYIENQRLDSGSAWLTEPATFPTLIEGLADWLDAQGSVGTIKAKLNELISEYNQLRADYNAGTVPTTAADVDPIP
jgi:hypothetical protein